VALVAVTAVAAGGDSSTMASSSSSSDISIADVSPILVDTVAKMETVEVKGVTVTTRRNNGSPVHRTFAEPVRKALWTQMDTGQQLEADNSAMAPPPGDKQHVLCVLLSTTMHVFFAASGYVYDVPLLFPVETVFALAEGLLVVRSLQGEAGGKAAASTQPTLYTLTHPLDDLVPVGSLAEPGSGAAATAISWSPSVHLVGVAHEEAPLLLLYDSQQKKHTAWLYWWRGSAMAEAMADAPPPAQQTIQLVASTPVRSSKPSASSTLSPLTPLHPSSGFKLPGPRVSLGGNSSNAANTGANSLFLMRANSPNVTPSKRRRLSVMAGSAPLSPLRALALSPVVPSTAHGGVTAVVATPPPPATAAGRTAAKIRPTHSPLAPPMTPAAHGSFVSAGSPSSSSKLPTPERMTMDRSGVISPASSRLLLNSNSQVAHSSNDGPASRLAAAENQRPLLPDLVVKQIWEQSDTSP